jgi:predicted Zn-dependent peptidase
MVYSEYNKTILPNGLTIVSEKIPSVRSISIGVWVKSGTRNESERCNGVAHFLEHMMFKGTEKRSALEIARSLESVGGYLNAFTSKEQTCFYAEILDEHLPRAVEVLSDMVCHSVFDPEEFEKERQVILDEISSVEDTPDEYIQDVFVEKLFPRNSLGFPILGTKQSIGRLTREQLLSFYRRHYAMENMVIAAAGSLEHQELVELCERYFDLPEKGNSDDPEPVQEIGRGSFTITRPVNQAHLCLGTSALPYDHPRKYELLLLNTMLGVGMGSRLFQNIREKHGLAYAIYSFLDFYRYEGLLGIYLGTEKKKLEKARQLLMKELHKITTKPISHRELEQLKSQVKGNFVLGLESTAKRMSRLAKMEIYLERFMDMDEVIEKIESVSRDSLFELSREMFEEKEFLEVTFLPGEGGK